MKFIVSLILVNAGWLIAAGFDRPGNEVSEPRFGPTIRKAVESRANAAKPEVSLRRERKAASRATETRTGRIRKSIANAQAARLRSDAAASGLASVSGYIGGNGDDEITSIVKDPDGNILVAGTTTSTDLLASGGAVTYEKGDTFLQKVKGDGSATLWRARIGGSGSEEIHALAVDKSGAIYAAGWTDSADFPTTAGAAYRFRSGMADGFVLKLSGDGKTVIWSSYLGGSKGDWIEAISVDENGAVAVTGYTAATDFPTAGGVAAALAAGPGALFAKFDPDGKKLLSSVVIGGDGMVSGYGIATTKNYTVVAGFTDVPDLPMVKAWQPVHQSTGLTVSASGGLKWQGSSQGMLGLPVEDVAVDPKTPQIAYAATTKGVYKTIDGGKTWQSATRGLGPNEVQRLAIDPQTPSIVYAVGVGTSFYKTTNGGESWQAIGDGLPKYPYSIAVNPQDGKILYCAVGDGGLFKSVDSGATWSRSDAGIRYPYIINIAMDPVKPEIVIAAGLYGLYRSADGGATWQSVGPVGTDYIYYSISADRTQPGVFYTGTAFDGALRSEDYGLTWRAMVGMPYDEIIFQIESHPNKTGTLLAGTGDGVYRSTNSGTTWSGVSDTLLSTEAYSVQPVPGDPQLWMAGSALAADGFVMKFDAGGRTVLSSTYVGGEAYDEIISIGLDADQNILIAGNTESGNFPTTTGAPFVRNSGYTDGFVMRLSASGGNPDFGTVLGGSDIDAIGAMSVTPQGVAVVAGMTISVDLPQTGGTSGAPLGGISDGFAAIVNPKAPSFALTTMYGGTALDAATAVASDGQSIWLGGLTSSKDLPVTGAALDATFRGGTEDGFLVRLSGLAASVQNIVSSLEFEVIQGPDARQTKTIPVRSSAGRLPWQQAADPNAKWLKVDLPTESAPDVAVTADASTLAVGNYSSWFELSAPAAGVAPNRVQVMLRVKASTPPALTAEGVLHGAELLPGAVSPGLVVRLLGEGFTSKGRTVAQAAEGRLPVIAGGARVLFNDTPAALEWVDSREIAAIVPYSVAGLPSATIVVERDGVPSAPVTVEVAPTAPGLFSWDQSGTGLASALNEDYSVMSADNPALRGHPIVLLATGEGVTDPAGIDGQLALGDLSKPVADVEVRIGGILCDIYYAGAAPEKPAGYLLLNLKVPEDAPDGPDVPVTVRIGGKESRQRVTVALK